MKNAIFLSTRLMDYVHAFRDGITNEVRVESGASVES